MMGSIYFENVSRGHSNGQPRYKERWVAEIVINGERKRRRSSKLAPVLSWLNTQEAMLYEQAKQKGNTDARYARGGNRTDKAIKQYRQRLRARQSKGQLVAIPGAENYLIDRNTLRCYSYVSAIQLRTTKNHPHVYVITLNNGRRSSINTCRVLWAIDNNVPLNKIPSSYTFSRNADGTIAVAHVTNVLHSRKKAKNALTRTQVMNRIIEEVALLKHCYQTGDTTQVMAYAMRHRDDICNMFMSRRHKIRPVADDLFLIAIERMEQRLHQQDTLITNIIENIVNSMFVIYCEQRKECKYNDNYNSKKHETSRI